MNSRENYLDHLINTVINYGDKSFRENLKIKVQSGNKVVINKAVILKEVLEAKAGR